MKHKRRQLEANNIQRKHQNISPEYIGTDSDTPDEKRIHIIIRMENTKYRVLVETVAIYPYMSKPFLTQIEELNNKMKKPISDRFMVANAQESKILEQVLIRIKIDHKIKYLLFRLVPGLKYIRIWGTVWWEKWD